LAKSFQVAARACADVREEELALLVDSEPGGGLKLTVARLAAARQQISPDVRHRVGRGGIQNHQARRLTSQVAYAQLEAIVDRLLDLEAAIGAARREVAGGYFLKYKRRGGIHRSEAVLIDERSGRDLAAGIEHGDDLARVTVERVDVQRDTIVEPAKAGAYHCARPGIPRDGGAGRDAKALGDGLRDRGRRWRTWWNRS
jgi:hypothetical protein